MDTESQWPPHRAREVALANLRSRIESQPDDVALRFELACLLAALGRNPEARDAYLEVLARGPSHRLALNNLGTLLHATGYRTAARTAYTEAVARHPADPMSRVNLANALFEAGEFSAAREHYETALRHNASHAEAHQGLSYALAELGDEAGAELHRTKGFEHRPLIELPYRGDAPPVSLLLLISSKGGNIPARHLLDDRVFHTFIVTPEFYTADLPLPPHQVVFNTIGDADLAASSLQAARRLLERTTAPVINRPGAVLATGRAGHERLSHVAGVVTPLTVTFSRDLLSSPEAPQTLAQHGFAFPLLIRSPGFHTGRHFMRVENAEALATGVSQLPGKEVMAIEFLNARGADGKARKYRVMMIDGQLYPLHLAISKDWKIHYFTAEMALNAAHRAEDAEFLENMPAVLGARAIEALTRIQTTLGLEYAGIDFGLSANGDILLFEANATMVVNPPEPEERWAYRRPAVDRIFAAVRKMILSRS
jgi:glutathione synthase/RimK-type ligase-like ATP-grasp enzyme